MMLLALGMPGQFSIWGFEAFRRLVARAHPELVPSWIDRLDSVDLPDGQAAFLQSQFPSRALHSAFSRREGRAVLFTTPVEDSTTFQIRRFGSSLAEAVRTVGASLALLQSFSQGRHVIVIDSAAAGGARAILDMMARHIEMELSERVRDEIAAEIGPVPGRSITDLGLSEADEGIATLVLGNALGHLRNPAVPLKSIWPHRVFFSGDKPNEEAPLVAEATGASRVLYYGPYFNLAQGRWRAKLTLGFSKDAIGLPLKVAAFGPELLAEARLRPRQEGVFAAQFSFDVLTPEHPVELHVRTEEGAIEGRIALGQVELTRTSPGPAQPPDAAQPVDRH